jgi:hypothetical protein
MRSTNSDAGPSLKETRLERPVFHRHCVIVQDRAASGRGWSEAGNWTVLGSALPSFK